MEVGIDGELDGAAAPVGDEVAALTVFADRQAGPTGFDTAAGIVIPIVVTGAGLSTWNPTSVESGIQTSNEPSVLWMNTGPTLPRPTLSWRLLVIADAWASA